MALGNLNLLGDGRRDVSACNKHLKSSMASIALRSSAHQQCYQAVRQGERA